MTPGPEREVPRNWKEVYEAGMERGRTMRNAGRERYPKSWSFGKWSLIAFLILVPAAEVANYFGIAPKAVIQTRNAVISTFGLANESIAKFAKDYVDLVDKKAMCLDPKEAKIIQACADRAAQEARKMVEEEDVRLRSKQAREVVNAANPNKLENFVGKYKTINAWNEYLVKPDESSIEHATFKLVNSPIGNDRKSGWYLSKGGHSGNVELWLFIDKNGDVKGKTTDKDKTK